MSQLDVLLSRLSKVKKTGDQQWMACCAAHEDKTQSLSIKELQDGQILIHCFAQCGAIEVLSAVGMDFEDLFPPKDTPNTGKHTGQRIGFADAYKMLSFEGLVLFHIAKSMQRGEKVESARLMESLIKIDKINQMLGRK